MRSLRGIVFISIVLTIFAISAHPAYADPFAQGNFRFSLSGGGGHAFGDNYAVIGIGAGMYLLDGLEVGMDFDAWVGGDPDIYSVAPEVRYVFRNVPSVKPYVGAFYRHTFIARYVDINTAGARAGGYFMLGPSTYFAIGAVYDVYLNCDKNVYSSCSDVYPEIGIAFSF